MSRCLSALHRDRERIASKEHYRKSIGAYTTNRKHLHQSEGFKQLIQMVHCASQLTSDPEHLFLLSRDLGTFQYQTGLQQRLGRR